MFKRLFSHSESSGIWQYKADGALDSLFLILVMLLLTIGTVMMFSAGYVYAEYKYNGDSFYFLKRQLVFVVIGIIAMLLMSKVNVNVFKKLAIPIMGVSLFLLVLVLFYNTGVSGADDETFKRWISVPFIGQFQPSDVAKIALIIFLAYLMNNRKKFIERNWKEMFWMLAIVFMVAGLVYLENHLSGTILILGIGIAMTFLSGVNKGWFIFFIIAAVIGAVFLYTNMDYFPDYIQERLKSWLDADYDPSGSRWQTNQSLYAIGSGGMFGTGLGGSKQKHLYLPEPQNDFVFAIVCEELGYIRTVGLLILFALFIWRGFIIGMRTKNHFVSLVVFGIIFQIALQTLLNIGVVTGMLPNTGISLPFFSYGGTALVTLLGEMGIVLSASRNMNLKE